MRHFSVSLLSPSCSYQVKSSASGTSSSRSADTNSQHGTSWSTLEGSEGRSLRFRTASQALGLVADTAHSGPAGARADRGHGVGWHLLPR